MFWWFGKKRDVERLKDDVQKSFDSVKQDFIKVGKWIDHLDGKHSVHASDISEIKQGLSALQQDIDEIKDFVSFFGPQLSRLSKHPQTGVIKQTAVEAVQTPVQTAVQTGVLENLTVMERAIVWAMINSEMKLSYEDLSAMFGKDKSTIRGQINAIKQKSEGLIEELVEPNGKKRVYIPEPMKQIIVKNVKVRVKTNKKSRKSGESL